MGKGDGKRGLKMPSLCCIENRCRERCHWNGARNNVQGYMKSFLFRSLFRIKSRKGHRITCFVNRNIGYVREKVDHGISLKPGNKKC